MHTFVLSDWITVKGNANSVIQSESDWLDLTPYEDVVFWIDCREASGTPTLALQTSPTKDETFFGATGASLYSATLASGTVVSKVTMKDATVPIARYLRWQLSAGAAFDATFRIMVSANAPGM
jgi:hypothetical protein